MSLHSTGLLQPHKANIERCFYEDHAVTETRRLCGDPVSCSYQLAELSPLLLCDPPRQRDGGHPAGLGDGDHALSPDASLIQVLRDLGGLPGTGLT